MTETSNDPSFVKLHTKVSLLLGLLGVAVPLLLTMLGFGISRIIDIQEEVGIVCMLQSDMHRVEDRLNNHIENDNNRFNNNSVDLNTISYLENPISLKQCHVNSILSTN